MLNGAFAALLAEETEVSPLKCVIGSLQAPLEAEKEDKNLPNKLFPNYLSEQNDV